MTHDCTEQDNERTLGDILRENSPDILEMSRQIQERREAALQSRYTRLLAIADDPRFGLTLGRAEELARAMTQEVENE